eukprot:scaffold4094_cov201-Ochromonas_danica.AAC.8
MMAVDILSDHVETTSQQAVFPFPRGSDGGEWQETFRSHLHNMRNTNSFMLMTINRVLDYAKASKGLKLVPKYETIDLMDTLYLPMNCMKDIQQRISIVLEPLSLEICSHIITDKQWLQENVLCLLSNAVKYSSGGTVTVSVKLEEIESSIQQEEECACEDMLVDTSLRSTCAMKARSASNARWWSPFSSPQRVAVEDGSNSPEYFAKVGPRLSFSSVSSVVTSVLRVEVEDTGIGMSDQAMSELFSPFKQNQRLAGGTGLGLFSLAQRVEALHGQCGVMHRRDGQQGSLFWFTMPYRPDCSVSYASEGLRLSPRAIRRVDPLDALRQSVAQAKKFEDTRMGLLDGDNKHQHSPCYSICSSTGSSGPTDCTCDSALSSLNAEETAKTATMSSRLPHVLLVDDSFAIVKMTSMLLKKLGYEVVTASNGAEALQVVQPSLQGLFKSYDVILMDLQMPVMDGLEATKRLRQMEENSNISGERRHLVIGLSANNDLETEKAALSSGFDAFLTKPFSVEAFQTVLTRLCSQGL